MTMVAELTLDRSTVRATGPLSGPGGPDRLQLVLELARQLGRRPTSNEVRDLLKCGRPVANRLLDEMDQLPRTGGPQADRPRTDIGPGHRSTTTDLGWTAGPVEGPPGPAGGPDRDGLDRADTPGPGWPGLPDRATGPDRTVDRTADTLAGPDRTGMADEPVHGPPPSHRRWLMLLALPAFVAIWSGWVGLGGLTGFGVVHPLPGIVDRFTLNTAITLPIGVETYAAYALRVWLGGPCSSRTRRFARNTALGSLTLGAAGQIAYHLMSAAHLVVAPWLITTVVSCLPVVVLGSAAALHHMIREDYRRSSG